MWQKIPKEIKDELEAIRRHTRYTGNEASITYCKRPDKEKLYIGSDFHGGTESTEIGDCSKQRGTGRRVGDAHSHPVGSDTVGILPSEADMVVNLETTLENKKPQIMCVTSPAADYVHCIQPKEIVRGKKLRSYQKAAQTSKLYDPYVIDNVAKDFEIGLFDRDTGDRDNNPDPKRVVKNAFGRSTRSLRRSVREMERGVFCDFVQDLTVPADDRISDECKSELKKKGLLDYLGIR